jgi:3-oxoacid CoA-transferase subunit A
MLTLVTGDFHRDFTRLRQLPNPQDTVVIGLGDVGILWCLDKRDNIVKQEVNDAIHRLYCVRGNHESRPENIKGMEIIYDEDIQGKVFYESEYPNIRYLMDGGEYMINGMSTLVIGGAYSVDKYYRLQNGWTWFPDEQLTKDEMLRIENQVIRKHYNVVLSHTCPYSWQPFDKFIPQVNQDTVDSTMEKWLETLKDIFTWDYWFFGHFHDDRMIDKGVYMLYESFKEFPRKTME